MWKIFSLLLAVAFPVVSVADCLPFLQARDHIGEEQCVSGKVLRVQRGARGVMFFDYCEDFRVCPFTVVVFPGRLRDIGDVRALENRTVEVHGMVKEYDGRAEIVLSDYRQLDGNAPLPKLPKQFDVEQRGHFSPGSPRATRQKRATTKKKQMPTLPESIPLEEE